jgi:hypothetical protein
VLILGPVILPSYGPKPQFAMVSATTIREGIPHDPACELHAGEHPFIRHPSFIAYRYLRIEESAHLDQMMEKSIWMPNEPCTAALLQRIVAGVCRSKLTPREFKRVFNCI